MPKIVENYVLERKIGSGQFGDVYKGYNRLNNQDIAVKVVQRKLIKGAILRQASSTSCWRTRLRCCGPATTRT